MERKDTNKHKKKTSAGGILLLAASLILLAVITYPLLAEYSIGEIVKTVKGEAIFSSDRQLAGYVLDSIDGYTQNRCGTASDGLEYVRKSYSVPEDAKAGYIPDKSRYGETDDPSVINDLLNSAYAKQLIGDQKTVWSTDLPLIEGATLRYYLDESILVLIWNEPVDKCWGTISEVFISDASQLRRKLVNDSFGSGSLDFATRLAEESNAVCAVSGDFYDHFQRQIGVCVYDGAVERTELSSDVCFVTSDGDFIMKPANSFADEHEAQKFVEENNISFSLCFGPIIVSDGKDCSPEFYRFGEIYDNYPRIAISQMGKLHYLTVAVNSNCDYPEYRLWGCDLHTLTEAMLAHGCPNAYTLDGGQTSLIILDDKVVSPLQYTNGERYVSDIIYFATAIPDK